MKVTQMTVKTLYNVEISKSDMFEIVKAYHDREFLRIAFPCSIIESVDVSAVKVGEIDEILKNVCNAGGKIYSLIAEVLGFDGWENTGYYDERKKAHKMCLFRYGDTMGA